MPLKPGDKVTLSREGKVFLTQYDSVSGFASLTRELGSDPVADLAEMDAVLDELWHSSVLKNHAVLSGAREALGTDRNVTRLFKYLEAKRGGDDAQETAQEKAHNKPVGQKPVVKRKLAKPAG